MDTQDGKNRCINPTKQSFLLTYFVEAEELPIAEFIYPVKGVCKFR